MEITQFSSCEKRASIKIQHQGDDACQAASSVHYTTSCKQSSTSEDGRNYRPKHVELIKIINKPLLLHLVGYLYYSTDGWTDMTKVSGVFYAPKTTT